MREFLISVASGLTVAILSAIFLRRPLPKSGPSQSMMMKRSDSGGLGRFLLIFAITAALVLAAFLLTSGRITF